MRKGKMMVAKYLRFSLILLVAVFAAACSGVPSGLDDANGQSIGSGDHAVTVVNKTGQAVCYILMSPSSDNNWNDDHLNSTQALSNDGQFTIRVAQPGEYDIMVLPCSESPTEEDALDVEMAYLIEGEVTWTASAK
jgi:hypothetical protein